MGRSRLLVVALYLCYVTCLIEGKPSLYTCTLQIVNGSREYFNFDCGHSINIEDQGAEIPNGGIRAHLTTATPPYACGEIQPPIDNNSSWAVLIMDSVDLINCKCACTLDDKAYYAWAAGYSMILVAESMGCPNNTSCGLNSTVTNLLPIITVDDNVGVLLAKYSRSTANAQYAAEVVVNAVYVDFVLLWTVFGVTVAVTISCTLCCFCVFFVCRGVLGKLHHRSLSRWSLRKLVQRKYNKESEMYDTCSICLEEFENGEIIRVLPCDHIYHIKCVDEWLVKWNRVCPVCKRVILRNERQPRSASLDEESAADSASIENVPLLRPLPISQSGADYGTADSDTTGSYQLESYAAGAVDVDVQTDDSNSDHPL